MKNLLKNIKNGIKRRNKEQVEGLHDFYMNRLKKVEETYTTYMGSGKKYFFK